MQRLFASFLVLFLFCNAVIAKDWLARIQDLESQPRTPRNTQQIAVCCNNYGVEFLRKSDWINAERWLKKAADLDRTAGYERQLAVVYAHHAFDLYDKRASRSVGGHMHRQAKLLAQRALAYDKRRADAYVIIGHIEYDNQKLRAAQRAYLNAKRLEPNFPGVDERLERIAREIKVDSTSNKTSNSFFEVRYENSIDEQTAAGLRFAMETARDVVGKDYNYRPRHKVILMVYSSESFKNLKLGPHWAGGVYDGKIRLPLDGEENLKFAVATLFHEYTHAIIDDLGQSRCPRWLNEGLSELQGVKIMDTPQTSLEYAAKRDHLIPLDALDNAFQSSDTGTVGLGYKQARSVAAYLVETQGYKRIKQLLQLFGKEIPLELALRQACNLSVNDLEAEWKAWLLAELAQQ